MSLPYLDRLQEFLEFWFDLDWDRDSSRPIHLVPYWWGHKYIEKNCFPLSTEEQNEVDEKIRIKFSDDLKNAYKDYKKI